MRTMPQSTAHNVVVMVRPKVGPWSWPHAVAEDEYGKFIEYEWATISATVTHTPDDGDMVTEAEVTAWNVGLHVGEAVAWADADAVVDAWFDAHDDEAWLWEFRLAPT